CSSPNAASTRNARCSRRTRRSPSDLRRRPRMSLDDALTEPVIADLAVMQPRVNLLPQRVKDRRSLRGRRRVSITLIVASLAVIGLVYGGLSAYQQVLEARLDSRLEMQQELRAEQRSHTEIAGLLDETQLVERR